MRLFMRTTLQYEGKLAVRGIVEDDNYPDAVAAISLEADQEEEDDFTELLLTLAEAQYLQDTLVTILYEGDT